MLKKIIFMTLLIPFTFVVTSCFNDDNGWEPDTSTFVLEIYDNRIKERFDYVELHDDISQEIKYRQQLITFTLTDTNEAIRQINIVARSYMINHYIDGTMHIPSYDVITSISSEIAEYDFLIVVRIISTRQVTYGINANQSVVNVGGVNIFHHTNNNSDYLDFTPGGIGQVGQFNRKIASNLQILVQDGIIVEARTGAVNLVTDSLANYLIGVIVDTLNYFVIEGRSFTEENITSIQSFTFHGGSPNFNLSTLNINATAPITL